MRDVRPAWALLLALALPAAARAADAPTPASSTPVVTPAGTLTAVEAMTSKSSCAETAKPPKNLAEPKFHAPTVGAGRSASPA